MQKRIAEFVKLAYVFGPLAGTKASSKSNLASGEFNVFVPYLNDKVAIRNNSSDWNVFNQVFVWKEYEYPIPFLPSTILDAGANVGYGALWFNRIFPYSEIVSLEPESSNYEMLIKNTKKHKTVTAIKAGLWSRSRFLRIIKTASGNWGFEQKKSKSTNPPQ